jgi:hypothetical protein
MSLDIDPLVPLAERPFAPPPDEDSERQTIWHNPTDKPVKLDLHYTTPKASFPIKPKGYEQRTGKRIYIIQPGATRAIPSEFDMAIQHTQCHHTDCLQMPFRCRSNEEGHEKSIVGGFGPQLENRGSQSMPIRSGFITLAAALDDVEARRRAAEEAEYKAFREAKLAGERAAAARIETERAEAEIAAGNKLRADRAAVAAAAAKAATEAEQALGGGAAGTEHTNQSTRKGNK